MSRYLGLVMGWTTSRTLVHLNDVDGDDSTFFQ